MDYQMVYRQITDLFFCISVDILGSRQHIDYPMVYRQITSFLLQFLQTF